AAADGATAVGRAEVGVAPCRCRLAADEANIAAGVLARFDVEHDSAQRGLDNVAKLGAAAAFFAVHGFPSLLTADLLSCDVNLAAGSIGSVGPLLLSYLGVELPRHFSIFGLIQRPSLVAGG